MSNQALEKVSENFCFGGWHQQLTHQASSTQCQMRLAIFMPPNASDTHKVPVLYWLSGLTCTDENFMQKAGAMKLAAELGIAIVAPDTSPRGDDVADDANYDLGQGAGFYVNATEQPWASHYQMYDYIAYELPALIEANFAVSDKRSIAGHSMGGHGALMIGLRNAPRYQSISAFSPIVNPVNVPWGQKAFSHYLGDEKTQWLKYDATELVSQIKDPSGLPKILIDQGLADNFLSEQLQPERFTNAAQKVGYPVQLRLHEHYDHSYYFISSFIDEHLSFHAKALGLA
ncbi:MAG: S-formylglutathione hydrolase [Vibrio sp.]